MVPFTLDYYCFDLDCWLTVPGTEDLEADALAARLVAWADDEAAWCYAAPHAPSGLTFAQWDATVGQPLRTVCSGCTCKAVVHGTLCGVLS
jgi:hypothetical protein